MGTQPNYERCSEGDQDKHGEHQPQKSYRGSPELTHAGAIQIPVIEAEKRGKGGSHTR